MNTSSDATRKLFNSINSFFLKCSSAEQLFNIRIRKRGKRKLDKLQARVFLCVQVISDL